MKWSSLLPACALLLAAAPASGEDFAACASAAEEGQVARDRQQLRSARSHFVQCGAPGCPEAVRKDCVGWLDDVERRLPTATFFADAGAGRDVTDVRVLIDGVEVASRLDGRSVRVDPGEHRVRFVWRGGRAQERTVLFVEGEKNRKVEARFDALPPAETPAQTEPSSSWVKTPWPWIAASAGVLGAAGFAGFGLSGRADLRDLDACAPRCPPRDVDAAETKYLLADVSLGIALVGLGIATYMFVADALGGRPTTPARAP